MKNNNMKLGYLAFILLFAAVLSNGCKKSSAPDETQTYSNSFNVWASLGAFPNSSYFVANLASVSEGTLDLKGKGVETTAKFRNTGMFVGNGYYYTVSADDRLGKYSFSGNALKVEKEVPSLIFSLSYSLCPAWIDKNTLFFGASNANTDGAVYAIVDVNNMTVTSSGTIKGIEFPAGYPVLYTGTPAYVNGKIYFSMNFFTEDWESYPKMCIAVINPQTLTVERMIEDARTGSMGNQWGGEMYGRFGFTDEKGDYYFSTRITAAGHKALLLRINGNTGELDPAYIGYSHASKEITELYYLGKGKAIAELYNPESYNYDTGDDNAMSYGIIDLASGSLTMLDSPEGKVGSIKNISTNPETGEAYVLIQAPAGDNYVWIYKSSDGSFRQGMKLPAGYDAFGRIDYMYEFK